MKKYKASLGLASVISFVAIVIAAVFFATPDAPINAAPESLTASSSSTISGLNR